ncbi:1-aminocyclopropane-1-carboxylate oxidase-like [Drosophila novamexicana]|uniref:1-aminocyclopropane-1-carboxylate oxidase-like n=1 Tax=Drosophila novamexicana TaxID=47314 RepID=UPI0011E5CEA6|nr:1-aminocyclopropane-1-carboxylate oxidase-like [Drosophila novamexicana]XP_030563804.1 1-aminocyclopropane-1-carboxylate oxidase-like [Drosophila novamexicana]
MLKTKSSDDKLDTLLSRSAVPIIDLAHCGIEEVPVKSVVNRVGHQLQKALSEKGMALLVNHGISDEKLKTAWDHLDDFVDLATDVKQHYIRSDGDNHGYVSPGIERFDGKTPELRHAFNICTLNAQNLPEEPLPGFADHISTLANDFKALASFILQALAVSLDIPHTFFLEKHSHMLSGDHDNMTTLRMLYYPPVVDDEPGHSQNDVVKGRCQYSYQRCLSDQPDFRPEHNPRDELNELDGVQSNGKDGELSEHKLANGAVIRCGAHVDYGTFTLLAQDSEGGLEVKLPGSEKWHRVGHLPGAILVNCGEILSIWTRERYPALQHRVVVPEQEHIRSRGRHSIAFFCHPDNITMISPNDLPQTDAEQNSACLKQRKKSFKAAKERVYNAYQLIQKKFKDTYTNNNHAQ